MSTLINNLALYLGGYSALIVAISGWIGSLFAKRIIAANEHSHQEKIERLKNDMEILSHKTKVSFSRYDELRASALQEIHLNLVEHEFFIYEQLVKINQKWNSAFESSQKFATRDFETEGLPPDLKELKQRNLALGSKNALAKGVLEFIAYEASSVWNPEFRKIKILLWKKEIYLDETFFEQTLNLIKNNEHLLYLSIKSISRIALDALDNEKVVDETTKKKIDESFNELSGKCEELFRTVKKDITREIRKILSPN